MPVTPAAASKNSRRNNPSDTEKNDSTRLWMTLSFVIFVIFVIFIITLA